MAIVTLAQLKSYFNKGDKPTEAQFVDTIDTLGGSGWLSTGNADTVDGTNFIGTTDNIPFNIRVNNQKAGRIDNTSKNVFLGYQAGNVTTGVDNVFIGNLAGSVNSTGFQNVAIGSSALSLNTSGFNNIAVGGDALKVNTTGQQNTAVGEDALLANTSGHTNTATAEGALSGNTTGYSNSAYGFASLSGNTAGFQNVAVGRNALDFNSTGSLNTAIGHNADVSANNLTNATAIGANAVVSASNSLILGSGANVGIGTSEPLSKLTVSSNTVALPSSVPVGTMLHIGNANSAVTRVLLDSWGISSGYSSRRANGTATTPTALASGDGIAVYGAFGYGATAYSSASRASVNMDAEENWTDAAQGARITFLTAANGSTTTSERMRINNLGNVGIGTSAPHASALLDITSTTKGVRFPNMTTGQRDAIAAPSGLVIYNTTTNKLNVFTTAWEAITSA